MNIKGLKVRSKVFLAPMEEINDIAFRLLCKKAGCGITYAGMVNPLSRQKLFLKDKPVLQLFCKTTNGIKDFIKKYDKKVSMWDFNLGCPSVNARKDGFGSYLTDLNVIEDILKTMKELTNKPLTVKIRKSKLSFDILKIAEKYCDGICIHPRTKEQGYSGEPNLDFAKKIKEHSKIPVIYSGNVNEKNAERLLGEFDYVMIGREAIGRPQIFSRLSGKRYDKTFKDYLKLAIKYRLPFRQIKLQAMNFTKEQRDAKKLRLEIFKTKSLEELKKLY